MSNAKEIIDNLNKHFKTDQKPIIRQSKRFQHKWQFHRVKTYFNIIYHLTLSAYFICVGYIILIRKIPQQCGHFQSSYCDRILTSFFILSLMGLGKAYYKILINDIKVYEESKIKQELVGRCKLCRIAVNDHLFYSKLFMKCITRVNYAYYISSMAYQIIICFTIIVMMAFVMILTLSESTNEWIWFSVSVIWGQFQLLNLLTALYKLSIKKYGVIAIIQQMCACNFRQYGKSKRRLFRRWKNLTGESSLILGILFP